MERVVLKEAGLNDEHESVVINLIKNRKVKRKKKKKKTVLKEK